jgi:transposase-like protein
MVMSESIRLGRFGLNPIMCYCPRCGKDNGEIALPGMMHRYWCSRCREHTAFGQKRPDQCPKCNNTKEYLSADGEYETSSTDRAPGSLCNSCEKEIEEHKAIVANGGVYWKCSNCKSEGVVKAEAELSKAVRKDHPAPDPIGVELESCPTCETKQG